MDSFLSIKNKSSISMGSSKLSARDSYFELNEPRFQDQLAHINCFCYHCINNTKPLQQPLHPRISAKDQYQLDDNQAYVFLVQKMSDYIGTLKIPDTFIAQTTSLAYMGSNKSRIKIKPNLSLIEIKKYFDSRRGQYAKIIKNQNYETTGKIQRNQSKVFNSTENRLVKRQSFISQTVKKQKQMKQIAFLNYMGNFSQIVNESSLSKNLNKRKNDPFWQQIASISLIPPYREDELTYHSYFYERTEDKLQQFQKEMQRVADIIDQQDRLDDITHSVEGTNPQNEMGVDNNEQSKDNIGTPFKNTIGNNQLLISRRFSIDNSFLFNEESEKQHIAKLSKELVAYFQVKYHIRISSCMFKYIADYEGNYYLTKVEKFIAVNLKKNQLKTVHDRLASLEFNDNEEMATLKMNIQQKEHQSLRNQLSELMADCLQKRKCELMQAAYTRSSVEICIYKRPQNQELIRIFKLMFPTFNQEEIFTNPNWKNQHKVYISNCRKLINKMIREDDGIRILKRFGITFYRTWK